MFEPGGQADQPLGVFLLQLVGSDLAQRLPPPPPEATNRRRPPPVLSCVFAGLDLFSQRLGERDVKEIDREKG